MCAALLSNGLGKTRLLEPLRESSNTHDCWLDLLHPPLSFLLSPSPCEASAVAHGGARPCRAMPLGDAASYASTRTANQSGGDDNGGGRDDADDGLDVAWLRANYRNRAIASALRRSRSTADEVAGTGDGDGSGLSVPAEPIIPMLHAWRALVPAWDLHRSPRDCTHEGFGQLAYVATAFHVFLANAPEWSRPPQQRHERLPNYDGGSHHRRASSNDIASMVRTGRDLCETTRCVTPPLTLDDIVNHQNPAKCSLAKAVVVNDIQRTGFGTVISQILGIFVKALKEGKIMIVEFPSWPYSQMVCGDKSGWECFFSPLSKCQLNDLSESNVEMRSSRGADSNIKNSYLDVRHLLAYITRPSARFARQIATLKQQIGWPADESVITVHVRAHADYLIKPPLIPPLRVTQVPQPDINATEIKKVVSRHKRWSSDDLLTIMAGTASLTGVRSLLLLSDDVALIEQVIAASSGTNLNVLSTISAVHHARTGDDCARETDLGCDESASKTTVVESIALDLMLGAEGSHFVGSFESRFTTTMFGIFAAKHCSNLDGIIVFDIDTTRCSLGKCDFRRPPTHLTAIKCNNLPIPSSTRSIETPSSEATSSAHVHATDSVTELSSGPIYVHRIAPTSSSRSWVVLADGNDNLLGALTLVLSFAETKSRYPVLVVTTKPVEPRWALAFAALGSRLVRIPHMALPKKFQARFTHGVPVMQKLQLLCLEQFEKVAVLDADSLVLRNVDAAMDLPTITGPRNVGWGCKDRDGFVSNFMVFEPDIATFKRMQTFMSKPGYKASVDKIVLNDFFSLKSEAGITQLPAKFMGFVKACHCNANVANVSITGPPDAVVFSEKPWDVRRKGHLFDRPKLDWDLRCPWNPATGPKHVNEEFTSSGACSAPFYCAWWNVSNRAIETSGLLRGRQP